MSTHAYAATRWLIDYGNSLSAEQLKSVHLAIVDPDNITPLNFKSSPTQFYAYISIGEANDTRSWWPQVKGASYLVEPNPDWSGALRVDIRAKAWQQLLLDQVIPKIVAQGFSGIFLDTIDVPLYLEEMNPQKYSGSRTALISFIKAIHKKFPKLGIIPNNGFAIWPDVGAIVNGALAEDVYTRYDFKSKQYLATPTEDSRIKVDALTKFHSRFKKPTYVVLYGNPGTPLIEGAITKCRSNGFNWYVADVSLDGVGMMEK